MSDLSFSLSAIIAFASLFAGVAGTWAVIRYRTDSNERSLSALREKTEQRLVAVESAIATLRSRVDEVRSKGAHELSQFQLQVTREFATNAAVEQVESRVIEEIRALRSLLIEAVKGGEKGGRG